MIVGKVGKFASRHKRLLLWLALFLFTLGEAAFWWHGVECGRWDLPTHSRYIVLQHEPVAGIARVGVNFRYFFLFWQKPPDTDVYNNLYELWLSDGSSPWRNMLHPLFFFAVPLLLIRRWHFSAGESLLWLMVFNIFREYAGEGWRLEPSFSDLWIDVITALLGTWAAARCYKRLLPKSNI